MREGVWGRTSPPFAQPRVSRLVSGPAHFIMVNKASGTLPTQNLHYRLAVLRVSDGLVDGAYLVALGLGELGRMQAPQCV